MMNRSLVRRKLARGETIWCAKACYQDPELVELIGSFGFDGLWICLEHKRLDPSTIYALIQACRLAGTDAIIRVKPGNYSDLLYLLEAGARGIMLPRVRHADEVREVIAAMKFQPLGRRGCDCIHPDAHFGLGSTSEYMAQANAETCLIVQIEETDVLPRLDTIAALPGVDVLFVGPGDLSNGLGASGQTDGPDMKAVLEQVAAVARRHGKVAGIPCAPDQVKKYFSLGYRFFNVTSDYRCLIQGLQKVKTELGALQLPHQPASELAPNRV